jgi:CheY-like chemotaxis protein
MTIPTTLETLTRALERWNLEVVPAVNGREAWEILQQPDPPHMALLDWMMPELEGLEVCRMARAKPQLQTCYLILLTSRNSKDDLMMGLLSGADDYVTKPFHAGELWARIEVGRRVLTIQQSLADRVKRLDRSHGSDQESPGTFAHLRLLQKDPRQQRLLAPSGKLFGRAHRRHVHPRHLPRLFYARDERKYKKSSTAPPSENFRPPWLTEGARSGYHGPMSEIVPPILPISLRV